MISNFFANYNYDILSYMRIVNIFAVATIFLLYFFALKKQNNVNNFNNNNNFIYISLAIITFVGAFLRIYRINEIPLSLAPDEASVFYDAICLTDYGTNRHGEVNAVYFNTWEFAGQSPVMANFASFFMRIFGKNLITLRMSQAVPAILTIVLIFFIAKKLFDSFTAIICCGILAISPWHIMMSRWALDCNLSAFFVMLAICTLVYSFDENGKINNMFYMFCVFTGISLYTYAPTNILMFSFIILLYLYIFFTKKINYKIFIPANIILALIALPMIYFVLVNTLGFPPLKTNFITIPYMEHFRSGDIDINIFKNITSIFQYLFSPSNRLVVLPQFSLMYLFSAVFFIYGFLSTLKNFNKYYILLFFTLGCFIQLGSVNHSGLWIFVNFASVLPLFIGFSIANLMRKSKPSVFIVPILYSISLVMFMYAYFVVFPEPAGSKVSADENGAVKFAIELNVDKVYMTMYNGTCDAFIYVALNNQDSPEQYAKNIILNSDYEPWNHVKQYDNFIFDEELSTHINEDNVAFILYNPLDSIQNFIDHEYKIQNFKFFSVAYK